jgi:hypothetical protein
MRYKVVPAPREVAFLRTAQRAVPLVPDTVEDCCSRIRDETDVTSRDEAREYLTFLEALELVAETPRGYRRQSQSPAEAPLADRFEANVFPVRELLAVVDGTAPVTPATAFEGLREDVPRWERDRHQDWEREWERRTEHLLEWAVTFDLVTADDDRYRPTE